MEGWKSEANVLLLASEELESAMHRMNIRVGDGCDSITLGTCRVRQELTSVTGTVRRSLFAHQSSLTTRLEEIDTAIAALQCCSDALEVLLSTGTSVDSVTRMLSFGSTLLDQYSMIIDVLSCAYPFVAASSQRCCRDVQWTISRMIRVLDIASVAVDVRINSKTDEAAASIVTTIGGPVPSIVLLLTCMGGDGRPVERASLHDDIQVSFETPKGPSSSISVADLANDGITVCRSFTGMGIIQLMFTVSSIRDAGVIAVVTVGRHNAVRIRFDVRVALPVFPISLVSFLYDTQIAMPLLLRESPIAGLQRAISGMEQCPDCPVTQLAGCLTISGVECVYPSALVPHLLSAMSRFPESSSIQLHALMCLARLPWGSESDVSVLLPSLLSCLSLHRASAEITAEAFRVLDSVACYIPDAVSTDVVTAVCESLSRHLEILSVQCAGLSSLSILLTRIPHLSSNLYECDGVAVACAALRVHGPPVMDSVCAILLCAAQAHPPARLAMSHSRMVRVLLTDAVKSHGISSARAAMALL